MLHEVYTFNQAIEDACRTLAAGGRARYCTTNAAAVNTANRVIAALWLHPSYYIIYDYAAGIALVEVGF